MFHRKYKVIPLSSLAFSADEYNVNGFFVALEKLLNEFASEGWIMVHLEVPRVVVFTREVSGSGVLKEDLLEEILLPDYERLC